MLQRFGAIAVPPLLKRVKPPFITLPPKIFQHDNKNFPRCKNFRRTCYNDGVQKFLLVIVALFGSIHLAAPEFLPEVFNLLSRGDIVETADYINGYGSLAVVFAFLLTLFVNALGFPPAIIFSTANTLIFGIVPGIVLSVVAETVGVTISFQLPKASGCVPSISTAPKTALRSC